MITLTSGDVHQRFGQVLETAQSETVVITRHGRPAAFLISPQEMIDLLEARRRWNKAVEELREWSS